jgi:hypothetical protein
MGKKAAVLDEDDLWGDDLDEDPFAEDDDEDARLLAEADELLDDEPVAVEVPECERTGQHELDGQSNCIHCSLHIEVEPEPVKRKRGERKAGEPRLPQISGHCSSPQTENPIESHLRCARNGAGNHAVPDNVFAPCPCHCHVEVEEYECSLAPEGQPHTIRPAPYWTGEWIDPDDLDMVTFVHVIGGRAQEECP